MAPVKQPTVRFDVSGALDLGQPVDMVASVTAPDPVRWPRPLACLVCVPGMSYGRSYFDLQVDGFPGYSFVDDMVARGCVVTAVDNLGTGQSTRPVGPVVVDIELMAAATAAVTRSVSDRLAAGTLSPGTAPVDGVAMVGVGHSLGGTAVIVQQARFASYDGIAVLGATTQPLPGIYEPHPREDELSAGERRQWATEHVPPKLWGSAWPDLDRYFTIDREAFDPLFHRDDVPAEVRAAACEATVVPKDAALDAVVPRWCAELAATITTPVLVAFGDPDLSPDVDAEAQAYAAADSVTVVRVEGSAHCHNLAGSRQALWDALWEWLERAVQPSSIR